MNTPPIADLGTSSQAPAELLNQSTSSLRWLVLALVCLLGLLAYVVYAQYHQAEADAKVTTRNLVEVIESHVSNDFARIDGVLTYVASRVSIADLQATSSSVVKAVQEKRLADLKSSFPIIDGLFIFDAEGALRYSSQAISKSVSIADRLHFSQLRDNPEAKIAFSDAEIARTTGKWSIAQLHALRDEQGRFLGAVSALISLDNLNEALNSIDLGPGGIALLRRSDTSRLTLRMPRNNEKDFNQPLPPNNPIRQRIEAGERSGTLTLTASVDGVKRLASFKRLDIAPFYAQVALAKNDYLANWRHEVARIAGVAVLLLIGFGYVLRKQLIDTAIVEAANRAQREAVKRFALLIAASPSGIWQTDRHGACTFVSAQWSAIAGIPVDTALNQGWAGGLHPDDRQRIHAEWVETTRTGAHKYLSEFRFAHPDGRIIWVHSQAVAETDADGQVIGWVGAITDITEQKNSEAALAESQAFTQGIFDSMRSQIAVIDHQGQILSVNVAWQEFSQANSLQPGQMTPKTGVGTNYLSCCKRDFDEGDDEVVRAYDGIKDILERRCSTFSLEYPCHSPQQQRWFSLSVTPMTISGTAGAVLVHDDITDSKLAKIGLAESEENFRTFYNSIHDFLFVLSSQGDILYHNDYVASRLGYTANELYGQSVLAVHPEARREEAMRIVSEMLAGETSYCPVPLQTKSGKLIPVETRVVSGHWNGQPAIFGLSRDMTERAQAEEALRQKTEALVRSNTELDQFTYVASHDLRQPLRMVNSYLQLLERRLADKLDDETREMMHFATDGAKRMDQMLVSLLEYSRVGRMGEPLAPLPSRSGVDEALHFLTPVISEAKATVRVSGDWPEVLASRDEFTRLWQNLIGNAVKYRALNRAPEINITVSPDAEGWRFCVSDNGIGIEPAQFVRLFKVFQRLHGREQYEGTGIGLAVARKIVERHGGRLWVESGGTGQGCRFYFSLPVQAAESTT